MDSGTPPLHCGTPDMQRGASECQEGLLVVNVCCMQPISPSTRPYTKTNPWQPYQACLLLILAKDRIYFLHLLYVFSVRKWQKSQNTQAICKKYIQTLALISSEHAWKLWKPSSPSGTHLFILEPLLVFWDPFYILGCEEALVAMISMCVLLCCVGQIMSPVKQFWSNQILFLPSFKFFFVKTLHFVGLQEVFGFPAVKVQYLICMMKYLSHLVYMRYLSTSVEDYYLINLRVVC